MTRSPISPLLRALCALGLVLTTSACGSLTKQVARDATPEAVDSGIEAALSEKNQDKVVAAVEPARVEQVTEKVVSGATDGFARSMNDEQRSAQVAAALVPVVHSLVDASVERALSDEHLGRIRELAKQATLGFQDAIDEVTSQRERGEIPEDQGNVLQAVDTLAKDGKTTLTLAGAAALGLGILLLIALAWAIARRHRYERDLAEHNRALEAAVRMLSERGAPLDEQRSSDEGAESDADAELVRSAFQRIRQEHPHENKQKQSA